MVSLCSQFAFVFACATVALAQVVPYPAAGTDSEVDPHPKYEFQYSVADPVTGDQKSQQESRDGDKVQGYYTVVESDGSLRRVDYYADDVSGFTATVSHQPGGQPPPAPATYQTYRPEAVAPVKVVAPAPVKLTPVPAAVVPAPVKVPAQQYYSGSRYPGYYNQGYYNQGYNGYQPAYYQNNGFYQQPAYYQSNNGYYQYPQQAYYQQAAPAYYNNNGQQASVTGYFSSPYANYALPGSGNPTGAVTSVSKESKK